MPRVHPVNPLPRQIGRCGEVLVTGKELCLQSPHPAGHAACPATARPPTIHRIAGSRPGRSASLTSSWPPRRPKTDRRNNPVIACRPFLPVRGSTGSWPAMSVKPSASSGSRQAGHPASVVIPQPWNASFRRRSKPSRRGPSTGSPAGFAICRAPKCAQEIGSHHRANDQSHQLTEPHGKCGIKTQHAFAITGRPSVRSLISARLAGKTAISVKPGFANCAKSDDHRSNNHFRSAARAG